MDLNEFVPSTYQTFRQTCLAAFKIGEPTLYHFLPKTDRERKVDEVISQCATDFKMAKLHFTTQLIEDLTDVEYYLTSELKLDFAEPTGIFVLRAELPVLERSVNLLDDLLTFGTKNRNARFIFCSEIDLTHPFVAKQFKSQTKIFNNVQYYPLYGEKDSAYFIRYLAHTWKTPLKDAQVEMIYKACGGHLWLLKEAAKAITIDPKLTVEEICNSEQMQFRIEQIYSSFLESEKVILKKIVKKEAISQEGDERHSFKYLKKMNLIKGEELTIPLLTQHIREGLPRTRMLVNGNHVLFNDVIVDFHFSRKELRILRVLLEKPKLIVSRDDIAKAIWPTETEESYSEWAIDRIIGRLRDKIGRLGLDKDLIKTVRGKGYMIDL